MSRKIMIAAAQMGPIQKAEPRAEVIQRMCALLRDAHAKGAEFVVFPELALTTFFPRWYYEDIAEADGWFESDMPNAATAPLFECAKSLGLAMSFGYAELHPGRAPLQYVHPRRSRWRSRWQVSQGPPPRPC